MKNCKEIENNLPLYLDNLLSGVDKQAIEEHLKSCPNCAKALAQLQKAGKLVNGLGEVEPPPWFKQKIMTKVRAEAQKKSFVQKWFYPLRIKIPVQVFTTIFIAVLAVYIYRAGDEQMKAVMPSSTTASVMEVPKNQLPEQNQKAPEAVRATVTKGKVVANKNTSDEKVVMYDVSSGAAAPKTEGLKKELPREDVHAGAADAAKDVSGQVAPDIKANKYASAPAAKSFEQSGTELERKKANVVLGAAMKQSRAPQARSVIPKATIALRVADINAAAGEVEKVLAKYGARNIVRRMPDGKAILTAELKIQKMMDLIAQLKTIGRVEERSMPVDNAAGNISMEIEILNN